MDWEEFKVRSEGLIESNGYAFVEKSEFEWISEQIERVKRYEGMLNIIPSWFTKEVYLSYKEQGMTDREICQKVLFVGLTKLKEIKKELGVTGVQIHRKFKKRKIYTIYKGCEVVFSGDLEQCSEFLGIKPQSVKEKITRTNKGKHKSKYDVVAIEAD